MEKPDLPCPLVQVLDELGPGAILERSLDGCRAMYVDEFEPSEIVMGRPLVVMAEKAVREGRREIGAVSEDYKLRVLKDMDGWIVRTWGWERMLVE